MTQEEIKNKETISPKENIRQVRVQKLTDLSEKGINPYPYKYDITAHASELQEKYFQLSKDNFVDNNYETIDSFINNLHNKEKKNINKKKKKRKCYFTLVILLQNASYRVS